MPKFGAESPIPANQLEPKQKEPFLPKTVETFLAPDVASNIAAPRNPTHEGPSRRGYAAHQIIGIAAAGAALAGTVHAEPPSTHDQSKVRVTPSHALKDRVIAGSPDAFHESGRTQHWTKDHEPFASRQQLSYETATQPEDGLSKEARDMIIASAWQAAGTFLKRTDLPRKIETPEQQQQLEAQVDEVINQATHTAEALLERAGQKNTHLVAADRIAIQVFAKALGEFAQAHSDAPFPFGNTVLALIHRLQAQKDHILYSGFGDEALFHHTNLVYADIDGRLCVLRFQVIRDTAQRIGFLGETPEGLVPHNNLAALQSDLPWMLEHRGDIAQHRAAWTNTKFALDIAIDSGSVSGRQLQDLRFLQSYLRLHEPSAS